MTGRDEISTYFGASVVVAQRLQEWVDSGHQPTIEELQGVLRASRLAADEVGAWMAAAVASRVMVESQFEPFLIKLRPLPGSPGMDMIGQVSQLRSLLKETSRLMEDSAMEARRLLAAGMAEVVKFSKRPKG